MQDPSKIFEAFAHLYQVAGPWWTLGAVAVFFVIPTTLGLWREGKSSKYVDRLISAKEHEIERLAEDNRFWRVLFLQRQLRMTPAEIEKLHGSVGETGA